MVHTPGDYEDEQQDLIHPGYIAPVNLRLQRSNSLVAQDSAGVSNTGRKRQDSGASNRSAARASSRQGHDFVYSKDTMALQHEHGAAEADFGLEQGEMNGSADTASQGDYPQDALDHEGDRSGQGSEDLFLNIAESPRHRNEEDGTYGIERRRSRRTRASQRQVLPNNSLSSQVDNPVPGGLASKSTVSTLPAHYRRLSRKLSPAAEPRSLQDLSPMSPPESLDAGGDHYPGLSPHSSFSSALAPEASERSRHRPPHNDQQPYRSHTHRPSNLHYSREFDSGSYANTPPSAVSNALRTHSRADGASSAGSSAAPTTVWDEVEDLKSRIARLELTRNIPTNAVISNGSADRPRTATTTVTTISSSPKQLRKPSASGSDTPIGGRLGAELHPTLHTALAKCKNQLNPSLYRSLAAAASDALELAALTGGPQGTAFTAASMINGVATADRQVRRKADNVCRSLTEVCIALCDAKSISTDSAPPTTTLPANLAANLAIRRASLQQNGTASALSRSTRASTEPPERSTPSRALNRIEARRSSLLGLNGTSSTSTSDSTSRETETIHDSIEDTGSVTPKTASRSTHPAISAARTGTSLLHTRRTHGASGGAEDDAERARPLSRAMTEIEPLPGDRGARLSVGSGGHAQRLSLSRDFAAKHAPDSLHTQPYSSPLAHASSLRRTSRHEGQGSHVPGLALRGAVLDGSRRYGARRTPERGLAPEAAGSGGEARQRVVSLGLDVAGKGADELGRRRSLGRRVRQSTPGATAVGVRGE